MKNKIDKLKDFIFNFVLENNLDKMDDSKLEGSAKTKGVMLDTLNKLAILMGRLNKLSKDEEDDEPEISESDEAIIQHFLEKNRYRGGEEVKKSEE